MLIFRNKGQGHATNTKNQMTQNCNWPSTYLIHSEQLRHDASQMLRFSNLNFSKGVSDLHFEVSTFFEEKNGRKN